MNKQRQVVIILLMLFLQRTDSLVTWASPGNERILESTDKNTKITKKNNQEKINSNSKKNQARKLSEKDLIKNLKEKKLHAKTAQYLSLAMCALLVFNSLNNGIKKNRKMTQLKKNSIKMQKEMKDKSITDFLGQQNKKLDQFLARKQRKLQAGAGAMASVVKMGEQYIANQFGIPASLMDLITPMAGTLIQSLMSGKKKEQRSKKFQIDKKAKKMSKKKTHQKKPIKLQDDDDEDRKI